ncbi:MAG TPA: 50S ribosomal protein L25 [Gaiellaceae bacterium]|nr:50S ribosomal protein L25 [Gaiellaceae bacterium]
MAGERVKLEVQARDARGSAEVRRLRKQGLVPGVIYGGGKDPAAICVPERALRKALTGSGGLHAILDVVVEGDGKADPRPAILKDYQQDVITGRVSHIDLHQVRLDRPIQASIVVQLVGESAGAKEGGVLSQVSREINVEALPMEIPEHIEADVTPMQIGDTLRLADIPAIGGVTFLDDPEETVLATVTAPSVFEEPEEVLEEGEEGVELPEGEEAPEGAAEAPAEPGADAAGEPGTVED